MKVQEINKEIRENAIEYIIKKRDRKKEKKPLQAYAASWANEDRLYDSVGYTIFIVLPTSGCEWATKSGGCTMCSYIISCLVCYFHFWLIFCSTFQIIFFRRDFFKI